MRIHLTETLDDLRQPADEHASAPSLYRRLKPPLCPERLHGLLSREPVVLKGLPAQGVPVTEERERVSAEDPAETVRPEHVVGGQDALASEIG